MDLFIFIKKTVEQTQADLQSGSSIPWILITIVSIYTIVTLVLSLLNLRDKKSPADKTIGMLINILISSICVFTIGIIFMGASELAEIKPEYLSTRFYIEIIISSILSLLLDIIIIPRIADDETYEEASDEFGEKFLKALTIIILSIVGMLTNVEERLVGFGREIFGKSLGAWVFNAYMSWCVSVPILFVRDLFQLPFVMLFGGPMRRVR